MIKTSVVRQISVDDVRQIPFLTAIGMMAVDLIDKKKGFDAYDRTGFDELLNGYAVECDPNKKSMTYYIDGDPTKKVTFYPAGLDGIKIVYSLNFFDPITTYWTYDEYEELAIYPEDLPEEDWN